MEHVMVSVEMYVAVDENEKERKGRTDEEIGEGSRR